MAHAIHPLKLKSITIHDALFSHYTSLVSEKMLPYQWKVLSDQSAAPPTHCLDNFRIAAGEKSGHFNGVVFRDSDLYKWIEAASYCVENGSGDAFTQVLDDAVALIGRAQAPDGYLNTYYMIEKPGERWTNLVEGHELYCAGHLIEAAVAHHAATEKPTLLDVACRFANLICATFGTGEGQIAGYPGHQEIELALMKLYRTTGDAKYLECAKYFLYQRGKAPNYLLEEISGRSGECIFHEFADYDEEYAQTHLPPVEQRTAEGHAVRAMYMYAAMADYAEETGDARMLEACRALWENTTQKRMYITGSVGSSGLLERFTVDYDLPNNAGYCETCASIGLMLFGARMAAATGNAAYFDVVERALYNTVLAGIGAEGDRYFYVNPLEVWPEACKPSTSMAHVKPVRQPWFPVACCPPNAARTLASLGQYIYGEDAGGAYVHLYITSDAKTAGGLSISQKSALIQNGTIAFTITNERDYPQELRLRIPDYATAPAFTLDHETITPDNTLGYATLSISAKTTVSIGVAFHVAPRFIAAHNSVRADAGKMALVKGPVVYCLEEQDNGSHLRQIAVRPDVPVRELPAIKELPGDLPVMAYAASRLRRAAAEGDALYAPAVFEKPPLDAAAIPYCLWGNRAPGEMLVWQRADV